MNALAKIQDDWLDDESRAFLDALEEIFDEIAGTPLEVGDEVTGASAVAALSTLRAQGWYEFATDPGTSTSVYCETVKRFHRRQSPAQVPVFEVFSALRLLRDAGEPAAELLGQIQSDGPQVVLDLESLFAPRAEGAAGGNVPFGDTLSSLVVVREGDSLALHLVDPSVVSTSPAPLVDPTLPSFVSGGTGERVAALGDGTWRRACSEVLVARANALVGQSQAMFNATLEFMKTREQFGVAIGSFQALKHRAADVAVELYAAQQLSIHAAEMFGSPDDRDLALMATSLCGRAAVATSSESVQFRGGMGFTWEDGTHFGLKRIMSLLHTGPTVEDAERELGNSVIDNGRPRWAGGLDNA